MWELKGLAESFRRTFRCALLVGTGTLAGVCIYIPKASADGIDPPPGAPLNGKDVTVVIAENSSEQIKSVTVDGKKVTQNMDGSWSIGDFGSIQTGMVNVSDPEDKTSLSDVIDIRKGTATIIVTNVDDGFISDADTNSPAETNEMAKVKNGGATATYIITSPAEVPTPELASITLLAIGLAAIGVLQWSQAYKNIRYRGRIQTLISKDRQRD